MIETVAEHAEKMGLILRGGFYPDATDNAPGNSATILLLGNAGPNMWARFVEQRPQGDHPLDTWTQRVVDNIAENVGARAVYPFEGPPYYPFQTWAMRADTVFPSPIGPLVHPEFGLWHAYRAALLFDTVIELPERAEISSPCESCETKPCLSTCPVEALKPGDYDVPACRSHIASMQGSECLESGCLARRACPIGRDYVYQPDQSTFHMRSFLDA